MGCRVTPFECFEWVQQSGLSEGDKLQGGALVFLLRYRTVFLSFAPMNI